MKKSEITKMEISFCITTYNRLSTLKEAVESVLNLRRLDTINYEIVVSDDSTDSVTRKYLDSLSKTNPRIKYVKNKNKGQFNNLNNVLSYARYNWVVFLHDDDILSSDYLVEVLKALSIKNGDVSVIWGARNLIDKNGVLFNVLKSAETNKKGFVELKNSVFFFEMLEHNDYTNGGCVIAPMVTGIMVKRDLARKVGFEPMFFVNADGLFLWKLFYLSSKSLFINAPIINYRYVDDSERAKPSEQGIVYREMKGILLAMLEYMQANVPKKKMLRYRSTFMKNFYLNSIGFDSSITWIALRYKGSYFERVGIIIGILYESITKAPALLLKPSCYLSAFMSLLPRFILIPMYRVYVKHIL